MKRKEIKAAYREALDTYLATDGATANLARARECGRAGVESGLSLLELRNIHIDAMAPHTRGPKPVAALARIRHLGREFLTQSLVPFEAAVQGYREANTQLRELNATLEQRVATRTEEFESAMLEAEQANQAKSEFLSRVSHELRTPLNAVLGFAQLLELDPLDGSQREAVQRILMAGDHLRQLIDDVLDLSRIETGRLSLSPQSVSLGEVIQTALELAESAAYPHAVTCVVSTPEALDSHVVADRRRLQQVLLNLLTNAIKYNRDGGTVSVSIENRPGTRLRVWVRDTGIGISPDKLERLFSPFDRLGAEASDVEGA